MVRTFSSRTEIPASIESVFAFFSDASNLERITPKELHFNILSELPIDMRAGAIIEYSLRIHGVPVKWRTEITEFVPSVRFVDVQKRGPYKQWVHEHRFESVPNGTLMHDRVDYEVGYGVIGEIAHWLFVKRQIERIFQFREEVIVSLFHKDIDSDGRQSQQRGVK